MYKAEVSAACITSVPGSSEQMRRDVPGAETISQTGVLVKRRSSDDEQDGRVQPLGGDPGERLGAAADARARQEWFLASRMGADGVVPPDAYLRASLRRRQLEREQSGADPEKSGGVGGQPGPAGSVNWTPLGPSALALGNGRGAYTGRVTAIAAGPGSTRVYVGAANGGVWFSADGGATWTPLDEFATSSATAGLDADSQSTGAIAVRFGASAATDLVYVGTGEASGSYDSYQGIGVQRSASGGAPGTWNLEATNLAGTSIGALVIDPDNPALVIAATGRGIFRRPGTGSTATWTQAVAGLAASNGPVSDLTVAGSGATKRYYAAFPQENKVYSSPDGLTWTAVGSLPSAANPVQRIALAVAESDPAVVYAFRDDATLARLSGGAWYTVAQTPPAAIMFYTGQGWYDLVVAVDPGNASTVYLVGQAVSGLALFKSTISGAPGSYSFGFTNVSAPWNDPTYVGTGIHADGHALAFGLNSSGVGHDPANVWVGTDGGLWQSAASGANNTYISRNNGLAINEISHQAQRADTDAVVFSTSQDNGTGWFLGQEVWRFADGGDGGGVAVDQNNPARVIHQYASGSSFYQDPSTMNWFLSSCLAASQDGGASFAAVTWPPYTANTPAQRAAVNAEPVAFVAPIAASPPGVLPSMVTFGSNRLWLSQDWGATWVTLPTGTNPYLPATPITSQDVLDGNVIVAATVASDRLILAATYNQVWRFDKNTTTLTWTNTAITTSGLPPYHYITGLAVDNAATGPFYASLGGFGVAHLYYYDGSAWHPALPTSEVDTAANAVVVDPANPAVVYVGTDVGCWKGVKTGPTTWSWSVYSQGLPEVAVVDLAIHEPARLLRAGTHGRGVWEIPIDATSGQDPDIYLRVNYADTGRLVGGARFGFVEGAFDPTRTTARVYHWMSADIKVRRSSLAGLPPLVYPVDDLDFAVNVGDYVDTTDIETVDSTGTDQIFVEVHNRSVTPLAANTVRVALLLTDASAGLPPLPADYVSHLNDLSTTSTAWLPATSPWKFANPPYKYLNAPLDVRNPQVVEFDVTNLGSLFPGTDHICAAAFVTTAADQILATDTSSLDYTTMHDKHIAHRNLHLVAAGAMPITHGEGTATEYLQQPETFLIDFYNAGNDASAIEMVFDRAEFPGHLSVMLPKLRELADPEKALHGFVVHHLKAARSPLIEALGEWLESVGELLERYGESLESGLDMGDDLEIPDTQLQRMASLDRSQVFVAENVPAPRIAGVKIPAGGRITAAVAVQAPDAARPGDQYRLDILQMANGAIVGGSSYIVAVTKPRRRHA
jgi:hypothetical protein